jgi:hypothetical protein
VPVQNVLSEHIAVLVQRFARHRQTSLPFLV